MISIIIPTYKEAENISLIIPKLFQVLDKENINTEIIIVDDNSPDGTMDIAHKMAEQYPVRVHVRKNERGLATAVIKGFEIAKGNICLVMDADLSHPVEKVPAMVKPILDGKCEATVGSRYIDGGGCENWPLIRKIVSKGAGYLARGVTGLSDPTTGFMAIKKSKLDGKKFDPVGWKIVLEIIVKTNPQFIEIPIVFADRQKGKSKLNPRTQMDYMHHLWKLYCYKYPTIFQFIKFCLVGLSGLFVDTSVLVGLVELLSFDPRIAVIFSFLTAVSWNYTLNRFWTFETGKFTKVSYSYFSFITVCLFGLGIRIGVMHMLIKYAGMGEKPWYVLANFIGIVSDTIFNFLGSKYLVFSKFFGKP